jgi:hypothetical protein
MRCCSIFDLLCSRLPKLHFELETTRCVHRTLQKRRLAAATNHANSRVRLHTPNGNGQSRAISPARSALRCLSLVPPSVSTSRLCSPIIVVDVGADERCCDISLKIEGESQDEIGLEVEDQSSPFRKTKEAVKNVMGRSVCIVYLREHISLNRRQCCLYTLRV